MGLSDLRVDAVLAVSDIGKAKEFYEGKLGLGAGKDEDDGGVTFSLAEGTRLHIYPSAENAGSSTATAVAFDAGDDLEVLVDELAGKGVSFEQYDDPINTNEKGIATVGDALGAWFKDPDGNILALGS